MSCFEERRFYIPVGRIIAGYGGSGRRFIFPKAGVEMEGIEKVHGMTPIQNVNEIRVFEAPGGAGDG